MSGYNRDTKHNQNRSYARENNDVAQQLPQIVLDLHEIDLFDTVAQKWAEAIGKTKSTQARNFYDYILKLHDRVNGGEEFDDILPFVKMLNSKVHYVKARNHVCENFVKMIKKCVDQVKDKETLKIFKLFFEAVIGFSKK
jgi:CRISPR-associated protein Csm2